LEGLIIIHFYDLNPMLTGPSLYGPMAEITGASGLLGVPLRGIELYKATL